MCSAGVLPLLSYSFPLPPLPSLLSLPLSPLSFPSPLPSLLRPPRPTPHSSPFTLLHPLPSPLFPLPSPLYPSPSLSPPPPPSPRIQTVDATENGLTSLPSPYAWKSQGVKDIRMNGNLITRLDLADCGRYWPHLECLYLGQNKIKEVCVCVCVCARIMCVCIKKLFNLTLLILKVRYPAVS